MIQQDHGFPYKKSRLNTGNQLELQFVSKFNQLSNLHPTTTPQQTQIEDP